LLYIKGKNPEEQNKKAAGQVFNRLLDTQKILW